LGLITEKIHAYFPGPDLSDARL